MSISRSRPVSESAVSGIVLTVLLALITYPKSLGSLSGKYMFLGAYVAWMLSIPLLGAVVRHRRYRSITTLMLWTLRWWALTEYLLVSLITQQYDFSSLLAFAGVVAPTFLYEVGAFAVIRRIPLTALRLTVWLSLASLVPVFIAAVVILVSGGVSGLLYSTPALREAYHYGWLNYVALLAVTCFLILQYIRPYVRGSTVMSGLCLMILAVTLSRAGAVCLALGLAVRESLERTSMLRRIAAVVFACLVVCFAFIERGSLQASSLDRTMMLRYDRWATALQSWTAAPWLGTGLHSFTDIVAHYVNPLTGETIPIGSAHNDYLDLLVRGGITYLGVFLVVVTSHLVTCFHSRQDVMLARLSMVVVTIILAASFVHNPLKNGLLASLFWFLMGIGAAGSRTEPERSTKMIGDTKLLVRA